MGQQINQLQSKKIQLTKEIERTSALLKKTEGQKQNAVSALITLRSGIKKRQQLLAAIDQELSIFTDSLNSVRSNMDILSTYLEKLQKEYLNVSRQHYIQEKLTPPYTFVLEAENLTKVFERFIYWQQYQNTRKKQLQDMVQTIHQLHHSKIHYELALLEKSLLLDEQKKQQLKLQGELQQKNNLIENLEGREAEFRKTIEKKKKEISGLEQEIKKQIEASMIAESKKKSSLNTASSFEALQGKIPLPAVGGTVIESFGIHDHHSLPGVKIKNNGIDFAFSSPQKVHNVLSGIVKGVMNIPGYHDVVLISHGDYFTLYGHLQNIKVSTGDELNYKTEIGTTRINSETGHPSLHFELWKGKTPLDPIQWLTQKEKI